MIVGEDSSSDPNVVPIGRSVSTVSCEVTCVSFGDCSTFPSGREEKEK